MSVRARAGRTARASAVAAIAVVLAALAGCASTIGRYDFLDQSYPGRTIDAPIEAFVTGEPSRPYIRVARLDAHLEKTGFVRSQFYSDIYVEDASFLRMDNITLGYTVNQIKAAKVRIYGTVQNAFIITKYVGLDPETNIGTGLNGSPGIDNNAYPRSRTIVFGIRIGL